MKLAVLIITRGDRPIFLENCKRMLSEQTLQPDHIEIVDDAPLSDAIDITYRYRTGYDRLRNKGFDIIALIEDDDYYAPNYLETMMAQWNDWGMPDLLGTNYTIYYHIGYFSHFTMHHNTRASAMNTLIKPDLDIKWCADTEPYTDIHLWNLVHLNKVIFNPKEIISVGIKHGVGKCGGHAHVDRIYRYTNVDPDKSYLKSIVNERAFEFYSNYFNKN